MASAHLFQVPLRISQRSDPPNRFGLKQSKRKREATEDEDSDAQADEAGATDYETEDVQDRTSQPGQSGNAARPRTKPPRPHKPHMKQTQFVVLNTILHRCLLEGDFARAARAFGLLLRTEFNGQTLNIRKHGMWGIGAELLLQRPDTTDARDVHELSLPDDQRNLPYHEANFDAARAYYERLILQYPYQKLRGTRDVTALDLYPAFFSLWTHQVYSRSSTARAILSSSNTNLNINTNTFDLEADNGTTIENLAALKEIRQKELVDAEAILARIDAVTVAPPFDRDRAILRMRGMVALWVADLIVEVRGLNGRIEPEVGNGDAQEDGDDEILRLRGRAREAFRVAGVVYNGVWEGETGFDDDNFED